MLYSVCVILVLCLLSPSTATSCTEITDPHQCLSAKTLGVPECSYCSIHNRCYRVGNPINVCPGYCCASTNPVSKCWARAISDIDERCLSSVTPSNTSMYIESNAIRVAHLAGATYCDPANIMAWNCSNSHCDEAYGFTPKRVVSADNDNLRGYIGYDAELDRIVIAFRGTLVDSFANWVTNFDARSLSPYKDNPESTVHMGWFNCWQTLSGELLDEIAMMPHVPIILTGHSMGGVIAALAAFDLTHTYGYSVDQVYTYGAPRPGNYLYTLLHNKVIQNHWRLTHGQDMVPHQPNGALGYYHAGHEVFYPVNEDTNTATRTIPPGTDSEPVGMMSPRDPEASEPGYVICDGSGEDPTCADRCGMNCLNVGSHHLVYIGVNMDGRIPC